MNKILQTKGKLDIRDHQRQKGQRLLVITELKNPLPDPPTSTVLLTILCPPVTTVTHTFDVFHCATLNVNDTQHWANYNWASIVFTFQTTIEK